MGMQHKIDAGIGLTAQHVRLLEQFDNGKLFDALAGVGVCLWLPGHKQKFGGHRAISGTRPLAVNLECRQGGGLVLSAAVSRPDRKTRKMIYQIILSFDFTQPMKPGAKGVVVSTDNAVIARTGLSLLGSLLRFGEKRVRQPRSAVLAALRHPQMLIPFNPGDETFDEKKLDAMFAYIRPELRAPYKRDKVKELVDSASLPGSVLLPASVVPDAIVGQAIEEELAYEDYSPVLGVPHWNPADNLREQKNPAGEILSRHKIGNLDEIDEALLTQMSAELRLAVLLGEKLSEHEVLDALAYPDAPVVMSADFSQDDAFTAVDPENRRRAARRLVAALRVAAGTSRAAREATDEDLLAAAKKPGQMMALSRLSKTQVFEVAALELPEHYAGDFLSPVDWTPPSKRLSKVVA